MKCNENKNKSGKCMIVIVKNVKNKNKNTCEVVINNRQAYFAAYLEGS